MTKKIFSAIFSDLPWKLLALLLAFALWLGGVNASNPYQNDRFSQNLQFINLEILERAGVILVNEDALRDMDISVVVRALRQDLERLNEASRTDTLLFDDILRLTVDFLPVDIDAVLNSDGVVTQRLNIQPNLDPYFEPISWRPDFIEVQLDVIAQETFDIEILQSGDVPPNFELRPIRLANRSVTVSGARTDIREIYFVGVDVDVVGVHGNTELPVSLHVIDRAGNDITDRVQLNVSETTALVSVWPVSQVDIAISAVGMPASGFAVRDITFEPETVSIMALAELLDTIEYIPIRIDLSGVNASTIQEISISEHLPPGVYLAYEEISDVTVTVAIEPMQTRTINVPRDYVRARGVDALYHILDDAASITVRVRGPQSLITTLPVSDVRLELDLRELPIGVHRVPLAVNLPEGFSLEGAAPTLYVQIHEPAADNDDGEANIYIPTPPDPDPPEYPGPGPNGYDDNGEGDPDDYPPEPGNEEDDLP